MGKKKKHKNMEIPCRLSKGHLPQMGPSISACGALPVELTTVTEPKDAIPKK